MLKHRLFCYQCQLLCFLLRARQRNVSVCFRLSGRQPYSHYINTRIQKVQCEVQQAKRRITVLSLTKSTDTDGHAYLHTGDVYSSGIKKLYGRSGHINDDRKKVSLNALNSPQVTTSIRIPTIYVHRFFYVY